MAVSLLDVGRIDVLRGLTAADVTYLLLDVGRVDVLRRLTAADRVEKLYGFAPVERAQQELMLQTVKQPS